MIDLGLAVAHHLPVFGLAIMLAMELAYLRADPVPLRRLSGLDAGYGAIAVLVRILPRRGRIMNLTETSLAPRQG